MGKVLTGEISCMRTDLVLKSIVIKISLMVPLKKSSDPPREVLSSETAVDFYLELI